MSDGGPAFSENSRSVEEVGRALISVVKRLYEADRNEFIDAAATLVIARETFPLAQKMQELLDSYLAMSCMMRAADDMASSIRQADAMLKERKS